MTQPTRRDRPRKKGHALVLASNVSLLVGIVVAVVGVFVDVDAVVIAGFVIVVVAIVASVLNSSRRRKRIAQERKTR